MSNGPVLSDDTYATGAYLDAVTDALRALVGAATIDSDAQHAHLVGLMRNVDDARKAFWLRTAGGTDGD